jgi:hypothetical protein
MSEIHFRNLREKVSLLKRKKELEQIIEVM